VKKEKKRETPAHQIRAEDLLFSSQVITKKKLYNEHKISNRTKRLLPDLQQVYKRSRSHINNRML
jgi:hypothetical protein